MNIMNIMMKKPVQLSYILVMWCKRLRLSLLTSNRISGACTRALLPIDFSDFSGAFDPALLSASLLDRMLMSR
ncbi:hypothetical protein A359_09200 [secondary endosymbiont of Ctenarytaina eucalypti]|uniref:Uncharacterized protein n=1 Tax=secondary endosymbiont of Ctenarytaina eucalypti TaxID=1199245 RepID=J3TY66_9ENTR|nr:hypothetical protein A359_09200 [secondary endosymbiont of Ctenarytaina eucalypti]